MDTMRVGRVKRMGLSSNVSEDSEPKQWAPVGTHHVGVNNRRALDLSLCGRCSGIIASGQVSSKTR
jgi:hypothetical protein